MSIRRIGLVLLAASAIAPGGAAAQNKVGGPIDLELFRPAIDSKGFITLNASQTLGKKELSFGIVTSYGRNVLVMDGERQLQDRDRHGAVQDPLRGHRSHHAGPAGGGGLPLGGLGFEFGFSLPVHLIRGDRDPNYTDPASSNNDSSLGFSHQGLGDVTLSAKVRLRDTSHHRFGVAALVTASLPTGDKNAFSGTGSAIVHPQIIIDTEPPTSRLRYGINAGVRLHGTETFTDDQRPDREDTRASSTSTAGRRPPPTRPSASAPSSPTAPACRTAITKQKLDFLLEGFGTVASGDEQQVQLPVRSQRRSQAVPGQPTRSSSSAAASAFRACTAPRSRVASSASSSSRASAIATATASRTTLTSAPTSRRTRTASRTRTAARIPTTTATASPTWTTVPERARDQERLRGRGRLPRTRSISTATATASPIASTSARTSPRTRTASRTRTAARIPTTTRTASSTIDDPVPERARAGIDHNQGCPDRAKVIVHQGSLEILEKIYFETNKAIIKPESFAILDAVAATLKTNTQITLLEIQGHADERGKAAHNLELTDHRAHAVKTVPRRTRASRRHGSRPRATA